MLKEEPTTYIANIRVSIKHMASIAMFYNSQGVSLRSSSIMASDVIRNTAELLSANYPVNTVTQAVEILRDLGYGDCLDEKAKHHRALFRQLSIESLAFTKQDSVQRDVNELTAKMTPAVMPSEKVPPGAPITTTKPLPKGFAEAIAKRDAESSSDLKDMRSEMDSERKA